MSNANKDEIETRVVQVSSEVGERNDNHIRALEEKIDALTSLVEKLAEQQGSISGLGRSTIGRSQTIIRETSSLSSSHSGEANFKHTYPEQTITAEGTISSTKIELL